MKLFRVLLKDSMWWMALAIVIGGVSAFSGISLIALINRMIERYQADFASYGWPFIGLLVALIMSGVTAQVMLSRIGHRIIYRLRLTMVNRVLATDIESLEQAGAHRLYAVLTKDINDIGNAFSRMPIAIYNALLLIGSFIYLGSLSLMFLGFTLAVVILGVIVDHLVSRKMYALYKQVRNTEDRLYKQYEASIEGRNELRLDAARRHQLFYNLLEPAAEQCRETKSRADVYWAINLNWTVILIFSLMGTIVFLGINSFNVELEVVTGYVLALMFLRTPVSILIDMIPNIMSGNVSLKKISQLNLAEYNQVWVNADSDTESSTFESLQLNQVSYSYPKQTAEKDNDDYSFALKPITMRIHAGETIFIIGGNGSGKSTFSKVLVGLYPNTTGQIQLDDQVIDATVARPNDNRPKGAQEITGKDSSKINSSKIDSSEIDSIKAWYRSHFVVVLSDFYLFDHILTNISPEVDDKRANHYLERLRISHKVQVKNGVLSTTDLSQGQKKRLALLSVYLSPRPIVLLDEWAADQDPVFRRVFYHEIIPELKALGKTVIAITHDDKYFDCADRIFRFDSGEVSELNMNNSVREHKNKDLLLSL